jgi:predicted dehydrogenase
MSFVNNLGLTVSDVRGLVPGGAGAMERSILLALTFAEGAVGTLSYSWEVPSLARGLRLSKIYGRRGTITFESNGLWVLAHGTRRRLHVPGVRDLAGHRAMWDDLVRALREGVDAKFTLSHARRDLDLVERAYASAGLPLPGSESP